MPFTNENTVRLQDPTKYEKFTKGNNKFDEDIETSKMEEDYEYKAVNLVAPDFMQESAKRGLVLHSENESGEGLMPATVADATRMANGEALSENKWRKISPWIARHISDLDAVEGSEITAGLVAMFLWGGGSSKATAQRTQAYAERIVSQLEDETGESAPMKEEEQNEAKGIDYSIELNPDKSLKMVDGKVYKNLTDSAVKEFNDEDFTIVHFITTENTDRYGDIVRSDGMDDSDYAKNPVVLFGHDHNSFPIGKSLWRKNTMQNGVKGILAKTKFAKTAEGMTAYELWRDGFLNASSIGFIPKQYNLIEKSSDGEMGGFDFKSWSLLEYSIVPVPANAQALRLAYTKSIGSPKIHKAFEMQYSVEKEKELQEMKDKLVSHETLFVELKSFNEEMKTKIENLTKEKTIEVKSNTEITANLLTDAEAKSLVKEAVRRVISKRK